MTKKDLYQTVLEELERQCPETDTELHYATPFQLLVAVVLSAQCTDKRVNLISKDLFSKYPTAEAMADASIDAIFELIRSVSYPNSKAKYLQGLSQMIIEKFGGNVPDNIEDLTKLPGVGRKTANVIQAIAFGKPTLAVDTHVYRVSHRLNLVSDKDNTPYKVEMELMKHIHTEQVAQAHFWLLYFGRYTCTALSPKCKSCKLASICKFHLKQIN
jgi:endonuclease-3